MTTAAYSVAGLGKGPVMYAVIARLPKRPDSVVLVRPSRAQALRIAADLQAKGHDVYVTETPDPAEVGHQDLTPA